MIHWEVPPTRRLAFTAVLAVMLASLVITVQVDFRAGGYTLAVALALAAVLRAVLPERYCLGLLVRSRQLDVLVAGLLAVAVFVTTGIVPPS